MAKKPDAELECKEISAHIDNLRSGMESCKSDRCKSMIQGHIEDAHKHLGAAQAGVEDDSKSAPGAHARYR